jgi:beta-xylosidase
MKTILKTIFCFLAISLFAGQSQAQVWKADNGDGTYRNPIIYADYSDPDVIRVGDDFYMVASSFTCFPGIPILHSNDLVNWTIVNHVYTSLPFDRYKKPMHGQGSWAPSIRYHDGLFYIYFCTPEEGLFMASATHPEKEWSLHHVLHVAQWEDPCPLWDDDGQAYLVRGKLCGGSMHIHKMSPDGKKILDDGKIVYWDDEKEPHLEGFKTMKKDGWYYIFAPAGGVPTGWQTVLRSKNIYGPYETKRVLDANDNGINGPHQGGLVDTPTGEWWFIHFQDKDAFGRIAHLQPAAWKNGWPVIGDDPDGDGCGTPVLTYRKPNVGKTYPVAEPQNSDEFNASILGLQWQWQAIPQKEWASLSAKPGMLRLYAVSSPTEAGNLHYTGNQLLQKTPAPEFSVETKIDVSGLAAGERAGLVVQGRRHTYLAVDNTDKGKTLSVYEGKYENCGNPPVPVSSVEMNTNIVWLKVYVFANQKCKYSYSFDGEKYTTIDRLFDVVQGTWIGAKIGLFCISPSIKEGKGYADVDYFRITSVNSNEIRRAYTFPDLSNSTVRYYMLNEDETRELPFEKGINYFSTDEKVAVIRGNTVKALAAGDCDLYFMQNGNKQLFARITVGWQVQNPILPYSWKMYVPDTEAHNFDGKIYIYGSLDMEYDGHFCSPYYISLMSPDLKRWESHGYSYTAFDEDSPYPGKILWDSDGNYYNGKYLLYGFYEADYTVDNYMFVLESDNPMGKFKNFRWIVGDRSGKKIDGISAQILVDDDGSRYIAYAPTRQPVAENYPVVAKLSDDNVIVESTITNMSRYVKDFYEAPSLRKRGDTYYLVYVENVGAITDDNHTPLRLSYATSKSILGEYTYRGTILSLEHLPNQSNIQGSIECFNGEWYVFYHRCMNNMWNKRVICAEKIEFDKDGLIKPVLPSSSGISEGLDSSKPIWFNSAVIQKNCRYTNEGQYGSAGINGNAEIGFRYVALTGKEKKITLQGTGLTNITKITVSANGEIIGQGSGSQDIILKNLKKGKTELVFNITSKGETNLETFRFF